MKFHPSKCKVLLMAAKYNPPLIDVVLYIQFFYLIGSDILDYVNSENDLGSMVKKLLISLNKQMCCIILSEKYYFVRFFICRRDIYQNLSVLFNRANQRLGIMEQTCHFVFKSLITVLLSGAHHLNPS